MATTKTYNETDKYIHLETYGTDGFVSGNEHRWVKLWNATKERVEEFKTYTWTPYGEGPDDHPEYERCKTDAEFKAIIEKVKAWEAHTLEIAAQKEFERLQEKAEEFNTLAPYQKKGQTVEVVGGRKHKGFVGVVFWEGMDKFARPSYGYTGTPKGHAVMAVVNDWHNPYKGKMSRFDRIGVKRTNENGEEEVAWVPTSQVKVVGGFEPAVPTLESARGRVSRDKKNWDAIRNKF